MTIIKNRHEIVFLYDVKDANPNGDPDDGNRPRTDHLGYNIVTDVRLKRTVRDYWISKHKGNDRFDVLVKRVEDVEDGTVKSMAKLITDALDLPTDIEKKDSGSTTKLIRDKVPERFIDSRCFGAAITLKNANVSLTGPVQFGIGRSLNRPRVDSHTITTTFASGDDKSAGTFGQTHVVDYSLICFGGIVSETTALDTGMSEEDVLHLWDGLWNGTKHLNTRSKFNHIPRILISVVSKEGEFQIGGLYRKLSLIPSEENKEAKRVNSEMDVKIQVDDFLNSLSLYKEKIEKIHIREDDVLTFVHEGNESNSLKTLINSLNIPVTEID